MSSKSLKEQLQNWKAKKLPFSRKVATERNISKTKSAKRNDKFSRAPSIQNPIRALAHRRNIQALYHFTPSVNLEGILTKGILPRSSLEPGPRGRAPIFNDNYRADRCLDASCCTIGFPNYQAFYKFQQKDPQKIWAVILLDPALLWSSPCLFNDTNAANKDCSSMDRNRRATVNALEQMFADRKLNPSSNSKGGLRDYLGLEDCMTTDPQAEVLIVDQVPVTSILSVCFKSRSEQQEVECRLPNHLKNKVRLFVDKVSFEPREDWEHWQRNRKVIPDNVGGDLDDEIPF